MLEQGSASGAGADYEQVCRLKSDVNSQPPIPTPRMPTRTLDGSRRIAGSCAAPDVRAERFGIGSWSLGVCQQLLDADRRRPEFADHDPRGAVGEPRGVEQRAAGGERQRHRADHGIPGAGDVGDLAGFGGKRRIPLRGVQVHAVLAARDQDVLAAGAFAEPPRRFARVVVGSDPHVRDRLGLVVIRRDQGRALVVVDVRDFRIDQDGDAGPAPRSRSPPPPRARETAPFR